MPCPNSIPPIDGHGLYVRLEVTDSGNNSHTSVFYVEMGNENDQGVPCYIPQRYFIPQSIDSNILEYRVSPNPVTNITNIEIENSSEKDISLTKKLFNTSGKLLLSEHMVAKKGENSFTLNMESYPPGMYFLRFSSDNTEKPMDAVTIKIIKQ
ncbi:MAG: T9SS C-terminal target domain-containing protein [Saprospirales bacterium]|nr:MAG: T9SS C-terminal target domain-containing protein [Saprospirales bacterium]